MLNNVEWWDNLLYKYLTIHEQMQINKSHFIQGLFKYFYWKLKYPQQSNEICLKWSEIC